MTRDLPALRRRRVFDIPGGICKKYPAELSPCLDYSCEKMYNKRNSISKKRILYNMERNYPKATITGKGERALRGGHPWVYAAEVTEVSGEYENGGLADVFSR